MPEKNSNTYIRCFQELDGSKYMIAGGKAANLGELTRIDGINVPTGFCVTTEAYKEITGNNEAFNAMLLHLSLLKAVDHKAICETSEKIRKLIEEITIPVPIVDEITRHLKQLGEANAYAVRSSATAEDLPAASFAGQQDTYLNIIGKEAILTHINKCWASLFTERAVIYRLQNGFDHSKVLLSVIIQQMILPDTAGIMFTADPITSNRKVLSIDASFGLGEALVSGLVNADVYKVCGGKIAGKKIPAKKLAIYAVKDGGTREHRIETEQQDKQALTDAQILQLERIGRKVEAHFGCPQDIEWCQVNEVFYIVQSRPITTLYPVPNANDKENHIYVSVGHQQMMTDAMKPFGLSFWQLTAFRPMFKAGGRLFVDIISSLSSPGGRKMMIDAMGEHDPLIKDALITITKRGDFIKLLPEEITELSAGKNSKAKPAADIFAQFENDPAIVSDLIEHSQTALEVLKQNIQTKSGVELFDFILEDIQQYKKSLAGSQSMGLIMIAIDAASWINENMQTWLGEKKAADTLTQSAPNNITSQMGLELLDVADLIRPYPDIIKYLSQCAGANDDSFLEKLVQFDGGQKARDAICVYLNKYGMRCAGEIDITNARWAEKPSTLISMLLNNIKNIAPNAGKQKFDHGLQEALEKEKSLVDRLMLLPDGKQKAAETRKMISLVRNFAGYREYPKYSIISRCFVCKLALLKEAGKLVQANIIHEIEDIYYLTFEEFREAVRTNQCNHQLISKRKDEYWFYGKLTPPRVITSDGEIIYGKYKHENLPPGTVVGLAVSSGVIEGRARVITDMEAADLEEGDILVTTFTDPGWTALFVSIKGLVTEVGGLMTHGAVIAREYGLPAVVGAVNATKLIKDGQRIRVNGTEGYIEIL